jgi:hypothetical protein
MTTAYEYSTKMIPKIVERRPFLFKLTADGIDELLLTSFIRSIKFKSNKIIINFLEDIDGKMLTIMSTMGKFRIDYLDRHGNVAESFNVYRKDSSPENSKILPPDVDHSDTEKFATKKLIWKNYSYEKLSNKI